MHRRNVYRSCPSLGLSLITALAWMACGQERDLPQPMAEDPATPPPAGTCTDGQTQCVQNNLKVCLHGLLRPKKSCLSSQICDARLGCIACAPSSPKTCAGDDVRLCNSDGTLGAVVDTCNPGQCRAGTCADGCGANNGTDLIYVVDQTYRLLSFNPRDGKNVFKLIGTLACKAGKAYDGSGDATPFSMSVDRMGRAWVLYNSGEIFWVSTKDAACMPSSYSQGQNGFQLFGMGYVSDAEGSDKETLYIAGGDYIQLNRGNVGYLEPMTLIPQRLGPLPPDSEYSPELTGTGKAEFYGYFPGTNTFVAQIDKGSGQIIQKWMLKDGGGSPRAWAFAHWGGRFYIFVTIQDAMTGSLNSQVILFDPKDASSKQILSNLPYTIVGAGVSTCAPIILG